MEPLGTDDGRTPWRRAEVLELERLLHRRTAGAEAQRYPQDYNGIAAAAPAVNMTNTVMQALWGAVLMQAAANPIPVVQARRGGF